MPKPGKNDHKFKNFTTRWYVPRVIYFDLESVLLSVYGLQPDPQKSSTQTIEIHQPFGYSLAVIELGEKLCSILNLKEDRIVSETSLRRKKEILPFHRYNRSGTERCYGLLDMRERFSQQ